MKAICQHYIGNTEEWKTANPKLYKAVWGFETTKDGKVLAKLGNGEDHWSNLKYFDIENIYGLPEALADTLANAKSYTDLKVNEEAQARIQGDANTLASAKTYTNEKASEEAQARQEADKNLSEGLKAEAQTRIQGDANTLASAKTYTNEKVGAEEQARIQGDANTLANAKIYTNEKVGAEEQAREEADNNLKLMIAALTLDGDGGAGLLALKAPLPTKNITVDIANLQATINDIPKLLLGNYTLYVRPGTITSAITIPNFSGLGILRILAIDAEGNVIETNGTTHNVLRMSVLRCTNSFVEVWGFNATAADGNVFYFNLNSATVRFYWCSTTEGSSATAYLIGFAMAICSGRTYIANCVISNKWRAVNVSTADMYAGSLSGGENATAFSANNGGIIGIYQCQNLTGTTRHAMGSGGIIVDGGNVMNAVAGSAALTGTPTAPTAAAKTNNTQIATTAYADRAAHPVGSYYTQYPVTGQSTLANMFPSSESPATLFGGTWTEMYASENVFFRTGALGSKRGQQWNDTTKAFETGTAGIEPDAIINILGWQNSVGVGVFDKNNYGGVFANEGYVNNVAPSMPGESAAIMKIDTSLFVPTDTTNHPKNRLIKVWKKTA